MVKLNCLLLLFVLFSCQSEQAIQEQPTYLRWVGDHEFDSTKDEADFKVCKGDEQIVQYFHGGKGPIYSGEKISISTHFFTNYTAVKANESGFIRIRFVVNCKGKAGRFRVLQADYDYNEISFDEQIIDQLVELTKDIEQWGILESRNCAVDYYTYLIFKIENGQLKEILP